MAAAMALVPKAEPLAFWSRFREQLENRIKEGNAVSGEKLWRTAASTGTRVGLTIQSVYYPADHVDCVFDPNDGVLSVTSGIDGCRFQWVGGTADLLLRGTEEFTVSEALNLLLDELVWPDE